MATISPTALKPPSGQGNAGGPPDANPFSLKHYSAGTRKIASFGLTLFIIGLIVATIWAPRYWPLSVLCSGAFMAIGWAVGFLFGVPRASTSDKTINTNLEQISDWLTKVLVGVGLTQLQKIPDKLGTLAIYIAKDYGPSGSSVFALSMVLYFSALGFLTGYLITRLALQQEFDEASGGDGGVQINADTAQVNVDQTSNKDVLVPPGAPGGEKNVIKSAGDAGQGAA